MEVERVGPSEVESGGLLEVERVGPSEAVRVDSLEVERVGPSKVERVGLLEVELEQRDPLNEKNLARTESADREAVGAGGEQVAQVGGESAVGAGGGQAVRTREDVDGSRPAQLVREFHSVYGMPDRIRDRLPASLDTDRLAMRMGLIAEETSELFAAVYGPEAGELVAQATASAPDQGERDLVETADALADLVYVVYGMALEVGIDLDAVLAEVHASNLSKLMPDGSVRRRDDGKILKGPDFREPDIGAVIRQRDREVAVSAADGSDGNEKSMGSE